MIQPEKYNQSLRALQQVIMMAPFLASKENQMAKVVGLLDAAEELPQLIADREECTAAFASALQAIAERYPYCRNIYVEFMQETGVSISKPTKELELV